MRYEDYGIQGVRVPGSAEQKVLCPKCSHTRRKKNEPCLNVNIDKGTWNCKHCSWAGAIRSSDEWTPGKREWKNIQTRAVPPDEKLYEFLATRGISREIVDRFGITADRRPMARMDNGEWEQPVPVIAFNYRWEGKIVNIKYRDYLKRFAQSPGGARVAYGLEEAIGQAKAHSADLKYLIIVEGEIDVLSFHAAGFSSVCSLPDGAIQPNDRSVDGKLKFLELTPEPFQDVEKVYLATDVDEPGRRTRDELAKRLGRHRCFVVEFPPDCKDANDVLLKHGAEMLVKCFEHAQPYPVEGVFGPDSTRADLVKIYEDGIPEGAKTGIKEMDELITYHKGQLTVVTGIPQAGKSTLTDFIAVNLMLRAKWKFAFFTPENDPMWVHLYRMARMLTGRTILKGAANRMRREELDKAVNFLQQRMRWIRPPDHRFTVDILFDHLAYLKLTFGIDGFILDPWNTVEHCRNPGESETEYTARVLNRFKYNSRQQDIHTWVVAHPTKMGRDKDTLEIDCPNLYSISGSANWFNVPDNGIVVHQSRASGGKLRTEFITQKIKHEFYGKRGLKYLNFDIGIQRYFSVGGEVDRRNWLDNGLFSSPEPEPEVWQQAYDDGEDPF